ncbi:MAG: T9SS type A sorting domain-containing protein, partial [Bacteroidota bacterium]|nr:T9SS type A sorting domain-containing protein [Bacteroidota bacterium]
SVLFGNSPNPSNGQTTIYYRLSTKAQRAEIFISDAGGKDIVRTQVLQGSGSLAVDCITYPAGMYFYSLIVDGKVIDTKQMVIQR